MIPAATLPHPPLVFGPLSPELVLVGAGLLVMLIDALRPGNTGRFLASLTFVGIVAAGIAAALLWNWHGPTLVLGGMIAADRYSVFFRLVILVVAAIAVVLSQHYLERSGEYRGEYYALLLFATAGMTLITASADLIMVFLALEILSLSLYLMTGFSFRRLASAEAAMKYFLLGAFSSAFFLFGLALAYGATGTTNLAGIATRLLFTLAPTQPRGVLLPSPALALVAAAFLGIGFAFKVSVVPFHMWTPDAYQGAPTPVTAFMSAGTKVAAFAAFLRVYTVAFGPLTNDWRPILVVLAALTMVVGSVLAIAQRDVKRMLAYSSVAHAGFILTAVAAGTAEGVRDAMFYLAVYAVTIVAAFGIVMLVSVRGERNLSLDDYRGLARRSPFLGGGLAVLLLSMAGIPPTSGFVAKVAVFSAAVRAGFWPLVLVAVLASVVAAFFYLRLIVVMYMREPEVAAAPAGETVLTRLAVGLPVAATVLLGVLPGVLFDVLAHPSVLPLGGFGFGL